MKESITFVLALILFVLMRHIFRRGIWFVLGRANKLMKIIAIKIKRFISITLCIIVCLLGGCQTKNATPQEIYNRIFSEVDQLNSTCKWVYDQFLIIEDCNSPLTQAYPTPTPPEYLAQASACALF